MRWRARSLELLCERFKPVSASQSLWLLSTVWRVTVPLLPQYSSADEAVATRTALHGVRWPQSNPKFLSVDFCEQDEVSTRRLNNRPPH